MPQIHEIQDLNIPELQVYTSLRDAQLRGDKTAENGVFIAESITVIENAVDAGCVPVSFLMERKHIQGKAAGVLARFPDVPVYTGGSDVLEGLIGYALTRGILCAMRRTAERSLEEVCRGAHRVAVLERLADASNVGAIFRSAAALGIDALLLTDSCCDPLYRKSIRVSMGTVFRIPWARVSDDAADWIARLKAMGFQTAALAIDDRAATIKDPSLADPERLALVFGNEGQGLSGETIGACDRTVYIPMRNQVDSLNVAAAAAIAFWQLRYRE